ncbi:uncharacterized protein PHALS_07271 [Plasmopara halstedii]|uniref:Uncharacterized protein n=1 Tax=Plasmopara halstedii TaxID=4781 RepID=A0A0P1B4T8_PLAHL|nr:uncharacterized protein PHALS_07271 [Plasmopara halstedii]CEG49511.1 hypothetical protein PHALS_07271 [Plasmopara halstedii]|eukprot:XP_024585880.1 hypothetical protein PHALS_07271 [Plasmopara halstedii]
MKHFKATHERFSIKTETTEGNKRRQVEAVIAAKAASTRACDRFKETNDGKQQ